MRNNILTYRILGLFLLLSVIVNPSFSQNDLDTSRIVFTSKYKATIPKSNKISESPKGSDSTQKIAVTPYSVTPKKIDVSFDPEPISPAVMKGEPLTKLYNSLIKVGMGTYTSPYGELWVNKLRSKKSSGGIRLKHYSSSFTQEGYGYAGFNDDEVSLYGKKFLRTHSLIGNLDYTRNTVHLSGYDINAFDLNRATTEQRFNLLSANAALKSHFRDLKRYNHNIRIDYYTLTERWDAIENNVKLGGSVFRSAFKGTAKVETGVDYYNYRNTADTLNNTIINFSPSWVKSDTNYTFRAGLTASVDIDTSTAIYIYPDVYFSYNIFENILIPYVGLSGGLTKNSFKTLSDANRFVLSELNMQNTHTPYKIYAGIKGTLSKTSSFNMTVSQYETRNMPLFVNDTTGARNRFGVIYDNAEIFSFHGEFEYQLREKWHINLSGDYTNFVMENEQHAWYTPQIKATLAANYNIGNKIITKLDVFYLHNQFAKTYVPAISNNGVMVEAQELKGMVDVNLGSEYHYNKKLGFFLSFNNIGAVKYFRWNNYPTQRFQVIGGLSYAF